VPVGLFGGLCVNELLCIKAFDQRPATTSDNSARSIRARNPDGAWLRHSLPAIVPAAFAKALS